MLNNFTALPKKHVALGNPAVFSVNEFIPLLTGYETQTSQEGYNWDNRNRLTACIYQHTLSGAGEFRIDKTWYPAEKGTGFLAEFPSDTGYRCKKNKSWEFMFIKFTGNTAHKYVNSLINNYGHFYSFSETSHAQNYLLNIYKTGLENSLPNQYDLSSLIYQFLIELHKLSITEQSDLPEEIAKAVLLIEEKYFHDDLDIECIAKTAGLSRAHFSRLFKHYLGQPPYAYLLSRRMNEAMDLLTGTDFSVKKISAMVGFKHYPHFCLTFKDYFKKPPGSFRKS